MFVYEFIYTTRGDKYFEELVSNKIPIYLKLKSKGLEDISYQFRVKKHEKKIINSKTMTVVMNDGKSFISHNSYILKHRFKKKGETNFVILDPRSDFINLLNEKNGKDGNYYQVKLLDVLKELLSDFEVSPYHRLRVYIHKMYNTMSVLQIDNVAMISLYRLSPGKSIVPHIEFKNTGDDSEYSYIKSDVKKLISLSEEVTEKNFLSIKEKLNNAHE